MTFAAGRALGPDEILSPLGAGGMGEVYRARDSRLGREVAIKVLPESLFARARVHGPDHRRRELERLTFALKRESPRRKNRIE